MKRLALAALLLASIGLPTSPVLAAEEAEEAEKPPGTTCKEPVTTHEYTPRR
jgi:hypothetical protein